MVSTIGVLFLGTLCLAVGVCVWHFWRRRRAVAAQRASGLAAVTVVVLGDVGHSPRMCYHAACLARQPACVAHVDVVASRGTAPPAALAALGPERVRLVLMAPFPALPAGVPRALRRALFLLYAPAKVAAQCARLFWALAVRSRPATHVLVQNPPSLPTLALAWAAARLTGAAFVVDWHNLGHTLLALALGPAPPFVRAYAAFERVFGARCADAHLAVTHALAAHLRGPWGRVPGRVPVRVLHDQPAAAFRPLAPPARAAFLARFLGEQLAHGAADLATDAQRAIVRTCVAEAAAGTPAAARTVAVLVSGTSWTPDEDFGVLLNALREYDDALSSGEKRGAGAQRDLLVVITGRGPQREMYRARLRESPLAHVAVLTAWLSLPDYQTVLGAADVGISLHQSSSQLDLPMKVLDMFGAGLPVFARGYPWFVFYCFVFVCLFVCFSCFFCVCACAAWKKSSWRMASLERRSTIPWSWLHFSRGTALSRVHQRCPR